MLRRVLSTFTATALLLPLSPLLGAAPAQALEPPVAFTSTALSSWQSDGIAWTVAQAQGKVFVGGTFTNIRPSGAAAGATTSQARLNFAVFDAQTGAPVDSCTPTFTMSDGTGTGASVRALNVSPDGKTLYVGGYFSTVNGGALQHLAALDIASCAVDTSFRPLPNGWVRAIASTATAVYFGGGFSSAGPTATPRQKAAAVTAVGTGTGALTTAGSLLDWAPTFDLDVRALALKPDASAVVVGGSFNKVNGVASHALVVVDPGTGAITKDFPTLIPSLSVVKDLAVDASGFYTGNEGTGFQVFDGRLAMNWDYTQRWRDTCLGATQAVVVYQAVLYSGSHAHDCSTMDEFPNGFRHHFLAQPVNPVNSANRSLLGWFPDTNDGIGEALGPRDMVVASSSAGDYLWAVGEFTTVNGKAQQGITRFGSTEDSAPSSPTTTVSSPDPGHVRVAWRQSLDTDDSTLTYRVYKDGASAPVFEQKATSWFWSRRQMTFDDTGLTPGSTHSYRVEVSDGIIPKSAPPASVVVSSTSSAYQDRVVADGASLLWRYDEASDVLQSDASANNNNGTLSGTVTRGAGALAGDLSKALTLGGSSSKIYSETMFNKPSTYTLETWFKTTTTTGGKLIGFGDSQVINSRLHDKHVYMTNDGRLVFGVYTTTAVTIASAGSYNDGAWHHVAATQDSAGMALYVDGARVGTNPTATNQSYRGYWRVGGDSISSNWPSVPTSLFWRGTLDETAVYPAALSSNQIRGHFDLGKGVTPSPDVTAPTAPADVATSVSGSTVTASWSAATDNVGVTGYDVHRSSASGFTPDASTLVGSTTSLSYANSGVPAGTWYYRVVAKDAAGNLSPASAQAPAAVARPDVTAPTAPSNVATSVSGSTVTASWSAATDDVGVTGYDVHRSSASGFTPDPSTLVGSTTELSYANSGVPAGTWYYRVVAKDAAGNLSPASAQAPAAVAPPSSTPTVVTVSAAAASYVNASAGSTNYATSTSLASRGSTAYVSYLRFVLPAAPAGQTLTGATLRIRTTTLTSAGSLESHTVSLAGDGWTETGLTWNNRPALSSAVGTIAGGTVPGTVYTTGLDATQLQSYVGTQGTLAVTNVGTDALWFWSGHGTSVSYIPQLVLTYS